MNDIPKIIHYCWFGKKKLSNKYLSKWKKIYNDYTFIEWNEKKFDINKYEYTKKAYYEKKYAFLSDFVRLYALINYGGIYIDTDVELNDKFNDIIDNDLVIGWEKNKIMTGLIVAKKNNHDLINIFNDNYINTLNFTPNTDIFTDYFTKKYNLKKMKEYKTKGLSIYEFDVFCCVDENGYTINQNTKTIHHYNASWVPFKLKIKWSIIKILNKLKGKKR